jgi:hypothetical protein
MNDLQDLERIVDACIRIDVAPVGLNISHVLLARLVLDARHAKAAGPCGGGSEDGPVAAGGFAGDSSAQASTFIKVLGKRSLSSWASAM